MMSASATHAPSAPHAPVLHSPWERQPRHSEPLLLQKGVVPLQATQETPQWESVLHGSQALPLRQEPVSHTKSQEVPLHVACAFAGGEHCSHVAPQCAV